MSKAMRQPNCEDTLEYIDEYLEDQSDKIRLGIIKMDKRIVKMKKALKIRERIIENK